MRNTNFRLNVVGAATLAALAILGFIALPAFAETHVGINVNLGGPGVVWQHRPAVVMVPGTQVSWVQEYPDADVYQSGSYWYCYRGGNWYRSSRYRGPWTGVNGGRVPHDIVYAPGSYHHFDHGVGVDGRRDNGRHNGMRGRNQGNHGNHGRDGRSGY